MKKTSTESRPSEMSAELCAHENVVGSFEPRSANECETTTPAAARMRIRSKPPKWRRDSVVARRP